VFTRLIGGRAGQDEQMIDAKAGNEKSGDAERDRPGEHGVLRAGLEMAGKHDQEALSADHGDAVRRVADARKESLFFLGIGEEIEAVRSDVVSAGTEREQEEKRQSDLEEMGRGNGEGHTGETRADEQLHRPDPVATGFEQTDDRAPQRLEYPGQAQPTGVT